MKVRERKKAVDYLKKRKLEKPYFKAKNYLEKGHLAIVHFKSREPKSKNIYYFRITRKYRAIGHFIEDIFVVTEISDHQ
jgi:hypothetical protein